MSEERFIGTVSSGESDDDDNVRELEPNKGGIGGGDISKEIEAVDKDVPNEKEHKGLLDKEKLYGHVNVKCELDKETCGIKGLCGLTNNMWAVCDYQNKCMKIFDSTTNTLKRYIRFTLFPNDVTEIRVKHRSVDQDFANKGQSRKSGAQVEPDKQRLVAVTLSYDHQIWFIDVNTVPARKVKTIKLKKECTFIEFNEDKIFVMCEVVGKTEIRHFLLILSPEGQQLQVIDNEMLVGYSSAFTIHNRRMYWTDMNNNKIVCINIETGKTVSQFPIEKSEPNGITVDGSGNIIVCGRGLEHVYKLSPKLTRSEPLSLPTDYTRYSRLLCFSNGKLYIAYLLGSQNDTVTVIQMNSKTENKIRSFLCCFTSAN